MIYTSIVDVTKMKMMMKINADDNGLHIYRWWWLWWQWRCRDDDDVDDDSDNIITMTPKTQSTPYKLENLDLLFPEKTLNTDGGVDTKGPPSSDHPDMPDHFLSLAGTVASAGYINSGCISLGVGAGLLTKGGVADAGGWWWEHVPPRIWWAEILLATAEEGSYFACSWHMLHLFMTRLLMLLLLLLLLMLLLLLLLLEEAELPSKGPVTGKLFKLIV